MARRKRAFWYIREIKPNMNKVSLIVTIVKLNSEKKFVRGTKTHRVAEFLVGDKTGIITLVIWDDMIDKIKVGETYYIKGLRPKMYMNQLRVVFTKTTTIEPAPFKIPLREINTAPKIY